MGAIDGRLGAKQKGLLENFEWEVGKTKWKDDGPRIDD
jgi:hypothetical protein